MKNKSILLFICILLAGPAFLLFSQQNDTVTVRVGSYINPPKIYQDDRGHMVGIFPDLLALIAEKEHWKIDYIPGTWEECLQNLENGRIDMMVDVAYSLDRSESYDFNNEVVFLNWAVVYAASGLEINSLLDLNGKSVGVMKGSIHTEGSEGIKKQAEEFGLNVKFVEADDYHHVFRLLDQKKIDAGVVNRLFGALYKNDYNVIETPVIFNPRHIKFAFRPDNSFSNYLIEKIDRHISGLKQDDNSVYYRILDKYLFDVPHSWLHRELAKTADPAVILSSAEQEWIRDHPLIRLGIDPEFFPFEYLGAEDKYSGIASDYISLLNKRLGLNMLVAESRSWKKAVQQAKDRNIDVLPCIGKTKEREEYLDYSLPYINFHRVVITCLDKPFISALSDISDWKVGVQHNSSHEGYLLENTEINPFFFETLKDALLALSDGKIDALVGNIASATYWIRRLNLTNLKIAAPVYPGIDKLHFAVRNDWPELVRIIDKGLKTITNEELQEIQKRWVQIDYTPGLSKKELLLIILKISVIVLIVCALIFTWIISLKKQIIRRKQAEIKLEKYTEELENMVKSRTISLYEKQESLVKMLAEKDILMQEIHHRVKNNLQIIISLLEFSVRYKNGKKLEEIVEANINRINTISLVHEMIVNSNEMTDICLTDFVRDICSRYITQMRRDKKIQTVLHIDDIKLDISGLISLGLIINELIDNSLRHSFRRKKKGIITIEISKQKMLNSLVYSESENSYPEDFSFQDSTELGLIIVKNMIEQLRGSVEFHNNRESRIIIQFPD